jgi:hypothetical protein
MATDLKEDKMIVKYLEEIRLASEDGFNSNNKSSKMSQSEIDEEFDNLDIEKFNSQ